MSDNRWTPKPAYVPPDLSFTVSDDAQKAVWFPNTYGPNAGQHIPYGSVLNGPAKMLADYEGMTPEQERQYKMDVGTLCERFGLDEGRAGNLASMLTQYSRKPPTDEEVAEWTEQSRSIKRKWQNSDERIERGNAHLGKYPELSKRLVRTGVGSHPLVVEAVLDAYNKLGDD